jgi:hypothetical protein
MALLLLFLLYEIAARLAAGTSVTTGKVVPATYEKRYLVSPNILVTSGDSDDMPINRRFAPPVSLFETGARGLATSAGRPIAPFSVRSRSLVTLPSHGL